MKEKCKYIYGKKLFLVVVVGLIFLVFSLFKAIEVGHSLSFRTIVQIGLVVMPAMYVFCFINIFSTKTIIKLMQDENTAVCFASLDALWPIYNIDKAWTVSNVLSVFKRDNRTIGYRGSKLLFVREYEKHKAEMKSLLEMAFFSSDKRLIQISGYAIAEIYLQYDAFENILNQIDRLNKEQADALLVMFIGYLEREEYNSKVKAVLYKFLGSEIGMELEHTWASVFYDERVELKRDKKFLRKLMASDVGGELLYVFMDYLKKGQKLSDYAEIIIDTGKSMFQDQKKVSDDYSGAL